MDACIGGHIDQTGEPETERFPHSLFCVPPPFLVSFPPLFSRSPFFFVSTVDACLGGHIDQPGEPETERFQHSHHGGQGVVWAGDTHTLVHTHTHTHTCVILGSITLTMVVNGSFGQVLCVCVCVCICVFIYILYTRIYIHKI
jgi:hypothetical protein